MEFTTMLFNACESGDLEETTRLITSADCDVKSIRMVDSRSVLDVSIDAKHIEVVKSLLPLGFDMDGILSRAVKTDDFEMVKVILKAIPEVTADIILRPLLDACDRGFPSVVRELLACISEHAIDLSLMEPVCVAFVAGHADVISALLKAGANIEREFYLGSLVDSMSDDGQRLQPRHAACLELLVDAGIDLHDDPESILETAVQLGCASVVERVLPECCDNMVSGAMRMAAGAGHVAVLKVLLTAPDYDAKPALRAALENGHAEAAELLSPAVPGGVEPVQKTLSDAVRSDRMELLTELLAGNPEQAEVNEALHRASAPAVVRLLLDAKAGVADMDNSSVLAEACLQQELESVQMLLDAGAQVGQRARDLLVATLTLPLKEGKEADVLALVQLLLKHDMDDSTDTLNWLATAYQVYHDVSAPVLQLVLARWPALLSFKCCRDYTLLEYAVRKRLVKAVQLLLEAGAELSAPPGGMSIVEKHIEFSKTIIWHRSMKSDWEQRVRTMQDILRLLMRAGADANNVPKLLTDADVSEDDRKAFDCMAACYLRDVNDFILSRPAQPAETPEA